MLNVGNNGAWKWILIHYSYEYYNDYVNIVRIRFRMYFVDNKHSYTATTKYLKNTLQREL